MKISRSIFISFLVLGHTIKVTSAEKNNKLKSNKSTSKNKHKTPKSKKAKSQKPKSEPVVIIGGGAAGTYLAWRLANADDAEYAPGDINLYERTDHISGRLYSPTVGEDLCTKAGAASPDGAHLPRTELGGMRIRTKDKIAIGVMAELGIETGPFYMNADDESNTESGTNPMYARSTLGMVNDFFPPNMIPFVTSPQSFPEDNPYSPLFEDPPKNPSINAIGFDPCDGETNKDVFYEPYGEDNMPFYTYSTAEAGHIFKGETADFQQWIDVISGYHLDNFEIGSGSPEWAGVLPSSGYDYIRPLKGLQDIPHSLHSAALDLGVNSHLNQEVTKVELKKNGKWLVTFRETVTSSCTGITKMKDNGSLVTTIHAEKVILALPAAALERIEFITPKNNGALQRTINGLANENSALPLMKLFAAWPERWWNTVNNLDTFSETEMPILESPGRTTNFTCGRFNNDLTSHVFAWYPGTQSRPDTIEANANACSDMGAIQFYIMPNRIPTYGAAAGVELQAQCDNDETCDACNPTESPHWVSPGISTRLRELVTQDLATMFRKDVPDAAEIQYRIWSGDDPVTRSDGVHFWKAGVKWWDQYKVALDPVEGGEGNIHLIGEVFSHNQGWTEGALETAEHLLQEVFGMDAPDWLDENDYCKSMPFFTDRASSRRRKMK